MKIISKISNNRKLKTTLLLVAVLAAACVLAVIALWAVRRQKNLDMTMAYDVSRGTLWEPRYGDHSAGNAPYASRLCVGEASVGLEGVSISQDAQGRTV